MYVRIASYLMLVQHSVQIQTQIYAYVFVIYNLRTSAVLVVVFVSFLFLFLFLFLASSTAWNRPAALLRRVSEKVERNTALSERPVVGAHVRSCQMMLANSSFLSEQCYMYDVPSAMLIRFRSDFFLHS